MMDEYTKYLKIAKAKGWVIPVNKVFGEQAWIDYWKAFQAYDNGETEGRPIVPHRSGRA